MWLESNKSNDSRFNLVKWFSVAASIAITLIGLVAGNYFSNTLTEHVLEHDANVMTEFVNSIVRMDTGGHPAVTVSSDDGTQRLAVFFAQLGKVSGILRANVYSTEKTIIWSSNAALVNKHFDDNRELEASLTGEPVANISHDHEHDKDEHVDLPQGEDRYVEYYLPIWFSESNPQEVIAVAEVYRAPLGLSEKLNTIQFSVWSGAIIGGLFLFVSLFWVIKRAANIIAKQDASILESQRLVTIGEMASTIAHGLRNPLSCIRSSAELARENENCSDTNQSLDQIMSESDNMDIWLKQYLSLMNSDSVSNEICVLHDIIQESIAGLSSNPLYKNISFEKDFTECSINIHFNCLVLKQIISGILLNAIEAQPVDNKVKVKTEYNENTGLATLLIIDNGAGFNKQDEKRLFNAFFTTKRNGLGIDLYLTKQILERNQGKISITHDEVNGTTACLTLPAIKL